MKFTQVDWIYKKTQPSLHQIHVRKLDTSSQMPWTFGCNSHMFRLRVDFWKTFPSTRYATTMSRMTTRKYTKFRWIFIWLSSVIISIHVFSLEMSKSKITRSYPTKFLGYVSQMMWYVFVAMASGMNIVQNLIFAARRFQSSTQKPSDQHRCC